MRQLPQTGEGSSSAIDLIPQRPTAEVAPRSRRRLPGVSPLGGNASQTVFGEGMKRARVMLVGEQPGDRRTSRSVRPAGGIPTRLRSTRSRADELRPATPSVRESEIEVLDPEVLVCLGETAVKAVMGPKYRVMKDHGRFVTSELGRLSTATLHPSAVLRATDKDRDDAMRMVVDDLRKCASASTAADASGDTPRMGDDRDRLHPAEHRAYRELYVSSRQLVNRWGRLISALEGTPYAEVLDPGRDRVEKLLVALPTNRAPWDCTAGRGLGPGGANRRPSRRDHGPLRRTPAW